MPAEILNRLGSLIPSIEASVPNKNVISSRQKHHQDDLNSEMRAMKFIWNLPIISTDYLSRDEQHCGLCHRKYDDEFKVCARGESPCCLPCGHIAGHHCLRTHLSPYEAANATCPFPGCGVGFPQLYSEPKQPTGDVTWVSVEEYELSDGEWSRQVAQLSNDSGVSRYDVKRFLSIEEVLARSGGEREELRTGMDARGFGTEAGDLSESGDEDCLKSRRKGRSLTRAPVATKDLELISRNF